MFDDLIKDTSADEYLKEIEAFPILKAAEEKDLAKRIQENNDDEAKNELMRSNLRLVAAISKKYIAYHPNLEIMDLIKEGNLGLSKAVEKYDYAKEYKFTTYATWWIKQAIERAFPELSNTFKEEVN